MKYTKNFLILAVIFVFSMTVSVHKVSANFTDLLSNHEFYNAINYAEERGIIAGYPDSTFRPDLELNRAEFTTMVIRSRFEQSDLDNCDTSHLSRFSDVPLNEWFTPFICIATREGIVSGYPDGTFRPGNRINLAEASTILVRSFGYDDDIDNSALGECTAKQLWEKSCQPWYQPFVTELEERHTIPTTFWSINDKVRRGEFAELIYRLENNIIDKTFMTYSVLNGFVYNGELDDMLRLSGDLSAPLTSPFTNEHIQQLLEPAYYQIIDLNAEDSNPYGNGMYSDYCRRFATTDVSVDHSPLVANNVQEYFSVTFNGKLTDTGSSPGCGTESYEKRIALPAQCYKEDADDPECDTWSSRSFPPPPLTSARLTLTKDGNVFNVNGATSRRIKIIRQPIERICRDYGNCSEAGYYDYTKIETTGTVTTTVRDGQILYTYRTGWQSIFGDLRGVPYILATKVQENGNVLKKFYYLPTHNLESMGFRRVPYNDCLANPSSPYNKSVVFDFCMSHDGSDFVVSSYKELGEGLTLWIDENYRF